MKGEKMTLGVIKGFDGFHLTTPLQFTQNSFPCFIYSPTSPFLQSVIFRLDVIIINFVYGYKPPDCSI